jgi:hypothetical protein
MSTPTAHRPDVVAFTAAVRGQLDDLPPEVVEELAGGLDADLAELAAESDDPLADRLGDPVAYAAELRAAAGLPPREEAGSGRRTLRHRLAGDRDRALARLRAQPWWPWLSSFAVTVRPVWWVLRAWVAWVLVDSLVARDGAGTALPDEALGWLVLLVAVVVSVELGRGRWSARWLPGLVLAGNVLAVVMAPVAADAALSPRWYPVETQTFVEPPSEGLYLDGFPVANLFPYGPDGSPLTGVRLLDDRGRPVTTGEDIRSFPAGDGWTTLVPSTGPDGEPAWNAYPLQESRSAVPGTRPGPGDRVTDAPLPEPTLQPMPGATAAPTATSGPAAPASPAPTASPASTASPAPTASASPTP